MKRPQMARKSTGPRRWVADADGSAGNNIRSGRVVKGRPPVRRDTGAKTLPGRGRQQPPVEKKKKRFRPGQLALKVDNCFEVFGVILIIDIFRRFTVTRSPLSYL